MALHLFSTPVQCTHCGTVVDDPTLERCPNCGNLLKERRAPRRLAGLEERYGSIRLLLGVLRFLAVIILVIGGVAFFGGLGGDAQAGGGIAGLGILMASVLGAVAMFSIAAFFELTMDVEENTRASFRLQQQILDELQEARRPAAAVPVTPDTQAAAR
jgi:predicted  nucleic acid-binding Zn-ribbon protein